MGWTPRCTETCFVVPPRVTVTVTVSPDFALVTAAVRSSADEVVLPSKAVITSPTFRPAFAAGEPATTCVILAPPATLSIRTPR